MKAIVIILLILAAIFAYLKFSPDHTQKKTAAPTATQTAAPAATQTAAPTASQQTTTGAAQTTPRPTSTVTEEINSVINYGIGATQLKAKQRATTKINEAAQKNNRDLEEALK